MAGPPGVFAYGYSIGAPTHSIPVSVGNDAAKWSRAMVGASVSTPSGNDRRSNVIQGMTELFLDIPEATLDIRFSSVRSLITGEYINLRGWDGVPVTADGFRAGADRDSLRGRFYGPNHEEAGGVFERDGFLGAFGASRQQ